LDAEKLREWWNSEVPVHEIARRFGVNRKTLHEFRERCGIEDRCDKYTRRFVDPTPDEIAERAAAIKAKNIERLRASQWHPG
jgi:hypothetical protein